MNAQAPLTDDTQGALGLKVQGYKIVRLLGRGGMGAVFEAEADGKGSVPGVDRVAVKILAQKLAQDPMAIKRFMHEARLTLHLDHRGLVKIYSYGQLEGGAPYILMEFLVGESLRSRIARAAPLPIESCLAIGFQLAESLSLAHKHGIVHRDLKPDNVMLIEDGAAPKGQRAKVFDFGIAKSVSELGQETLGGVKTSTDAILGTPRYMSPEQCRGGGTKISDRSDVYSLGIMLYEMAAGAPPFDGSAPGDLIAQHIVEAPPSLRDAAPAAPADLETLILHMLEKKPQDRPTMQQVARGMKAILDGQPTLQSGAPSAPTRMVGVVRRPKTMKVRGLAHPLALPLMLLLGVVFVGVAAIAVRARRSSPSVPPPTVSTASPLVAAERATEPVVPKPPPPVAPMENAAPVAGGSDAESTAAGANRVARPKSLPPRHPEKPKASGAKESKEILNVPALR